MWGCLCVGYCLFVLWSFLVARVWVLQCMSVLCRDVFMKWCGIMLVATLIWLHATLRHVWLTVLLLAKLLSSQYAGCTRNNVDWAGSVPWGEALPSLSRLFMTTQRQWPCAADMLNVLYSLDLGHAECLGEEYFRSLTLSVAHKRRMDNAKQITKRRRSASRGKVNN